MVGMLRVQMLEVFIIIVFDCEPISVVGMTICICIEECGNRYSWLSICSNKVNLS